MPFRNILFFLKFMLCYYYYLVFHEYRFPHFLFSSLFFIGAIVGGVIGGVGGMSLFVGLIYRFAIKNRRKKSLNSKSF